MSIMKTEYKVTVVHDELDNPDKYVDAAELVLNMALSIGTKNRTGAEALAEITSRLGSVADTMMVVNAKLNGANPSEITKDEIFAYLQSLAQLNAVTLCTLTSIMYNIEKD